MKIAGLQKMTLLDYPGRVACTVFLGGCNFRCPFCHNTPLLGPDAPKCMDESELLAFLERRQGLLEGVCVTGGEPTCQPGLPEFLGRVRALGFAVKLDTNGYRPDLLARILEAGLVDYVAMDVKNCPSRYAATAGLPDLDLGRIEESIRLLHTGAPDYELRTTVATGLHDAQAITQMAEWLRSLLAGEKARRLFIQPFADRDTVEFSNLGTPEAAELARFAAIARTCAEAVEIRG